MLEEPRVRQHVNIERTSDSEVMKEGQGLEDRFPRSGVRLLLSSDKCTALKVRGSYGRIWEKML